MGGCQQQLTANRSETASSGLTAAYFPANSQKHLPTVMRTNFSAASLHQGTMPSTYGAIQKSLNECTWEEPRVGAERQKGLSHHTRQARNVYLTKHSFSRHSPFNNTGDSLSSQYRVLPERLYASCCLGNSTLLSFNLILIRKARRGGGISTAVL